MRLPRNPRALLTFITLLGGASGCLVVAPLDKLEPAQTGGAAGHGGTAATGGRDTGGKAGMSGAGGQPIIGDCMTNADCIQGSAQEPYLCQQSTHRCIAAKNDYCPFVQSGAMSDPNTIYLGAFANLNAIAPEDNPIVFAQQLAIDELDGDSFAGLPDGPDGKRRPISLVVCDNGAESVDKALDHLINELGVPGLIATIKPGDFLRGFEKHGNGTFYFCPVTVTDPIAYEDDHNLIWSLAGQSSDFAPAYSKLLERTETYVRGTHNIAAKTPVRVALVTSNAAFDTDLDTAIEPVLRFNGMSIHDNDDAGNYLGITIDTADPHIDDVVQELVTFRPDIVVSAASEVITMPTGVLVKTESLWGNSTIAGYDKPLPTYVLSPYNQGDQSTVGQLIQNLADSTTEANPERRFFGLMVADDPDRTLINEYQNRLKSHFKKSYNDTANYYDAVYFLAYAAYAAGTDEPLSGPSMLRGMQRLQSGDPFVPGLHDVSHAFSELGDPKTTITLNSTLGPPGFDPKTGVRHIQGSVFCFVQQDASISVNLDVKRYDPTLKDFTGAKDFCFPGLLP